MYLRSSLEQTLQNESRFFVLFAYEYQPESNFFIVYNYNQKKKGKEQILFVKLVYLIKLLGWKNRLPDETVEGFRCCKRRISGNQAKGRIISVEEQARP